MTATKKSPVKAPKAATISKPDPQKKNNKKVLSVPKPKKEKSSDELIADNLYTMSTVLDSLGTTLEMLVQKIESIAYHTIATEEILAELVATNGLNLARVNARIRAKIAAGTDNNGNANQAIDVAASIASPLPRR